MTEHNPNPGATTAFATTTIGLIRSHAAGDESAFARLYARHAEPVRRSIARRLGCYRRDLVDPDDVLQETFLAAWRRVERGRLDDFATVGTFRNLLATIAVQKIRDQARAQHRLKRDLRRTVGLPPEIRDPGATPTAEARARELAELEEWATLQLGERDRRVLDLRELGMSYAAIGAELGCKPANAKLVHHRARERLRAMLRERGVGG